MLSPARPSRTMKPTSAQTSLRPALETKYGYHIVFSLAPSFSFVQPVCLGEKINYPTYQRPAASPTVNAGWNWHVVLEARRVFAPVFLQSGPNVRCSASPCWGASYGSYALQRFGWNHSGMVWGLDWKGMRLCEMVFMSVFRMSCTQRRWGFRIRIKIMSLFGRRSRQLKSPPFVYLRRAAPSLYPASIQLSPHPPPPPPTPPLLLTRLVTISSLSLFPFSLKQLLCKQH